MNKFVNYTVALALGVILFAGSNAHAADADGSASATVEAPIGIAAGQDLIFGTFAPTGAAGTVTLSNAGAFSSSGIDVLNSGTAQQGTFTITGSSGAAISVTVPASATLNDGGTNNMTATLTSDTLTTLTGGSVTLNVGATLAVGASQAAGSYTGTYNVIVAYN